MSVVFYNNESLGSGARLLGLNAGSSSYEMYDSKQVFLASLYLHFLICNMRVVIISLNSQLLWRLKEIMLIIYSESSFVLTTNTERRRKRKSERREFKMCVSLL